MRDATGKERGHCIACASAGQECFEFVYSSYPASPDDTSGDVHDALVCSEEYKRDPLLECLRKRVHDLELCGLPAPSVTCENCGCSVMDHAVLPVTDLEKRCLEAARSLFAPFELTFCIRQSIQDTSCLGFCRDNYTYGEVSPLSFFRLLDCAMSYRAGAACQLGATEGAFYDLGSGAAKLVCLAAMHSASFSRCVGIEVLPGLNAISRAIERRWHAAAGELTSACGKPLSEIFLLEADLFEVELSNAAVVHLNAGSWREPHLTQLRQYILQQMPEGCILVTIRQSLVREGCTELEPLEEMKLTMSWGEAPVFLARRRQVFCLDSMD